MTSWRDRQSRQGPQDAPASPADETAVRAASSATPASPAAAAVRPARPAPVQDEERIDALEEMGRTTIKVAATAVIASSLVGALSEPPRADLMSLPEPTPLVQVYQELDDDPLDDEDDEQDETESRWRRVLRMLKYLLVAAALIGSIAFGVLKGCARIAGGLLLPPTDEEQEQEQASPQTGAAEDERGVAW